MAYFLGIDIGGYYTKVVGLERKQILSLSHYFMFKTPFISPTQAGKNQIDAKLFWQEINKYIPPEIIKIAIIGVNLPSGAITAMTLLLPRVAKNELVSIAHTEAKRKMIPASSPNHIFETSLVGTRIVAKIPRYEILIARSDITLVQNMLELFKPLNTTPFLISFSSSILFSLLPQEVITHKDSDTAFVDIGLSSINASILREGRLNFFRNTAFGLKDIIQDIAKNISISEEDTEKVILEKGVPEMDFDLKNKVALAEEIMRQKYETSLKDKDGSQKEEVNLLELRSLWQSHIERILHELRRSFTFYKEQTEGRRVEHIYFLGGGAQIKNLVPLLIKQLGGQWQIVYPFKNIHTDKAITETMESTPIFANAASLALCIAQKEKNIEIVNFLPQELKLKKDSAKKRFMLLSISFATGAIFTVASLATLINNRLLKTDLAKVEEELTAVKDIANTLQGFSVREAKIQQDTAKIEEAHKKKARFALPLIALADAIPKEILLTEVSIGQGALVPSEGEMPAQALPSDTESQTSGASGTATENYHIKINAEIVSDYETASKTIAAFCAQLQKTSYFINVRVSPLTLESMRPQKADKADSPIVLTRSRQRSFSLIADIVGAVK